MQFTSLRTRKDKQFVRLLWDIHRQHISLMSAYEGYLVYSLAKAQTRRPGAFAEVGVYKGASAKMICEAKGDKTFHVFDTFDGLPQSCAKDRGIHREHQYAVSLEAVQEYLRGYDNLHFHKGLFPHSAAGLDEPSYAFAHFDVDLYEGTRACLEYFYPRMIPGGIILSHDYTLLAGVEEAFQEFFADKPEQIIDLPTTQCMVIKL
jgi:hypothetical protein